MDQLGTPISGTQEFLIPLSSLPIKDPQITYNGLRKEFLVVYQYGLIPGSQIYGSRINSINGTIIGGPIILAGTTGTESEATVTYNPNEDFYLLAFQLIVSNFQYPLLALQLLDTFG